jgi:hypothetical protein
MQKKEKPSRNHFDLHDGGEFPRLSSARVGSAQNERIIAPTRRFYLTSGQDFSQTQGRLTDLNLAEDCLLPARFFVSSGPAIPEKQLSGGNKGRKNHESINSTTRRD